MIKHREYLLVTVPEDASKMKVWDGPPRLQYFVGNHPIYEMIYLPPGTWQLIGLASELTEEQWREIVEEEYGGFAGHIKGYRWYEGPVIMDAEPAKTAKDSGQSLLRSHNLNAYQTVILKLIQP